MTNAELIKALRRENANRDGLSHFGGRRTMTEYINKQDAYRIALHDGGPVCAEKIAQLEPLKIDIKPATLKPKTLSWDGVDLEELKKTCEKVSTVSVKNDVNSEWTDIPVDEFFRMLGDKMMMEGKRWPEH